MAHYSQALLITLLVSTVTSWPYPYPWLQTAFNSPQVQQLELIPSHPNTQYQNNPFLAHIFQKPQLLIPDANYIISRIPFNIDSFPGFIDEEYFPGYKPGDIDINFIFELDDKDLYQTVGEKPGNNHDGNLDQNGNENGNDKDDRDDGPGVNDHNYTQQFGGDGSKFDKDEELPIDPRKDEAKYSKPH